MIDDICGHIHNYFTRDGDVHRGTFIIEGGALALPFLAAGQHFRIVGSALNDGVYQYPAEGLSDEAFTGEVWAMRPPRAFLQLAEEIALWQQKYGAAAASPYQSENVIGVYSYTRASGGGAAGSEGWAGAFRGRLDRWRKLPNGKE